MSITVIRPSLADVIIPGLPKDVPRNGHPAGRWRWATALNRAQGRTGKPCKTQYSHGSSGYRDADGIEHYFGGSMIFSAWCACGQFRYHGHEEGRRFAVRAHKTWMALTTNDVVTLHWSRPELDGHEFVILAVNGHRITLEDTAWGDVRVVVDRAQIDSTGRRWVDKNCWHQRYLRRALDGRCMAYGCGT